MGLEFVLSAFFELTYDRQVGFGAGPIPWNSIYTYGVAHDMRGEDLEDFIFLIREIDHEFMAYHKEQSDKQRKG